MEGKKEERTLGYKVQLFCVVLNTHRYFNVSLKNHNFTLIEIMKLKCLKKRIIKWVIMIKNFIENNLLR